MVLTHVGFRAAVIALLAICAYGQEEFNRFRDGLPPQEAALVNRVVPGFNTLGLRAYRLLANPRENAVFSPLGASLVLAMLLPAAEGDTHQRLRSALGVTGLPESSVVRAVRYMLDDAKAVTRYMDGPWGFLGIHDLACPAADLNLHPMYRRNLADGFRCPIVPIDYHHPDQSAAWINAWVARRTFGKINDAVAQEDFDPAETRLTLVNVVMFSAQWLTDFELSLEERDSEFRGTGGPVKVPMMSKGTRADYYDDGTVQLVALPYILDQWELVIVLPRSDRGLATLLRTLDANRLQMMRKAAKPRAVNIFLPRFSFRNRVKIRSVFERLGLAPLFHAGANLGRMTVQGEPSWVAILRQDCFIEVDESGTRAGAVTAAVEVTCAESVDGDPVTFRCDHPFLFAIRCRRTGAILFIGQLAVPKPP